MATGLWYMVLAHLCFHTRAPCALEQDCWSETNLTKTIEFLLVTFDFLSRQL